MKVMYVNDIMPKIFPTKLKGHLTNPPLASIRIFLVSCWSA